MALNDVVYNKTVDVAQSMPVPVVFAKQHEGGKRQVIVKLLKDGQPFTIGTGVDGYIQGATAPNPVTKQPVRFKRALTSLDTTANTASFYIVQSMTAEIGITQCEIALYSTGSEQSTLCTANINIEVQGTGMSPQDEMASDDYQAIVAIKAEVTAMRDEVRTKTAQAIAAQGAAETAAQNAYNSALGVQKIVAGNEAYTKQEADLKYSVAPRKVQTSTTGELKLTDADYGLSYLELQGNSEQYTATGTNLFDVKQLVKTMQALAPSTTVVLLDGDEKVVEFSNTSFHDKRVYEFKNDITKSYKFGVWVKWVSGNDPGSLYITAKYKDGSIGTIASVGKALEYIEVSGTIPQGKEIDYIYFSFGTGAKYRLALDRSFLYPIDAPSSEKPTGGYGTPTPEYPSEVQSIGDIPKDVNGVEIRNLLDEEWIKSQPESAWSVFADSAINRTSFYLTLPETFKTKLMSLAYAKSNVNNGESYRIILNSATPVSKTLDFVNQSLVTGTKTEDFSGNTSPVLFYIFVYGRTDASFETAMEALNYFSFMVTNASEIDEYRPYIGENNGLVKIESQGKNLVNANDKDKWVSYATYYASNDGSEIRVEQLNNTNTSTAYIYFNYEKNKNYTLYCKAKFIELSGVEGLTVIGIRKKGGSASSIIEKRVSAGVTDEILLNFVATQEDLGVMLYVNANVNKSVRRLYVYDLMVVEGTKTLQEMKALKYKPYYNQITWIPLREPLRSLPDGTTDVIDKEGNVIQSIDRFIDMKYGIVQESAQIYDGNLFHMAFNGAIGKARSDKGVYCNIMKYKPTSSLEYGIAGSALYDVVYFNLKGKLSENTVELARQFLIDNNATFYCVLKTPDKYQIPVVYIETYDQETNVKCLNKIKPSSMGLDYKIAISSLIKRLEALESTAVMEVNKNV